VSEIADHALPRTDHQPAEAAGSDDVLKHAAKKLPRRRFFSDMPDKGLFGLVSMVGFTAICYLKTQGYPAEGIAVSAVAAMILYGVIAFQIPVVQMRLDRLGDNFYYLGFIYTLASLTAALMQLQGGMEIDQLLGSFGIALVTTIVGIAGRVLFVQLRSELDDIEERVRKDLAATSSELRGQLNASIQEFQLFRTVLLQTLQETSKAFTDASKDHIARVDEMAKAAAERSAAAFSNDDKNAPQIKAAIQSIAKNAADVSKKLSSAHLPTERLDEEVAKFATGLRETLNGLGTLIDEIADRSLPRRRWYWPFGRGGRQQ